MHRFPLSRRFGRRRRRIVVELLENRQLLSGGDFSLDFVAAAPFTYNHATGGGAYDDRTIGNPQDIHDEIRLAPVITVGRREQPEILRWKKLLLSWCR